LRQRHPFYQCSYVRGLTTGKNHFQKITSTWRTQPVSDKIVHTTDGSFDADVTKNEKPVLIDFWAEWCGPCKMIAPLLDEAADEYADKLAIVKLNVDENPNTAQKFGIRSIPTLILFKDGAVQAQKLGAMSKSQLAEFIDTNI
jgi:thioredoxin 1